MTSNKHYGFFRSLYLAFYAKSFYRDVAQRWTGIGIRHLLLLLLLNILSHTLADIYLSHKTVHVHQVIDKTSVTIADLPGRAKMPPSPTDSKPKHLAHTETDDLNTPTYPAIDLAANTFWAVAVLGLALTIGAITALIARRFTKALPFKTVYRLALVATTPGLVLSLLLLPQQWLFALPGLPLLTLLSPFAYFLFGLYANRSATLPKE